MKLLGELGNIIAGRVDKNAFDKHDFADLANEVAKDLQFPNLDNQELRWVSKSLPIAQVKEEAIVEGM
tara:strand:- start:441 stop:644 length:204 start_codon:yes stop_codon:yes gene_type:complete